MIVFHRTCYNQRSKIQSFQLENPHYNSYLILEFDCKLQGRKSYLLWSRIAAIKKTFAIMCPTNTRKLDLKHSVYK